MLLKQMYHKLSNDACVKGRSDMPRPPDRERRATTLAAATDYVLDHGLAGLSLRPLAAALGTSTRMLLYDFGNKEELIMAVLAEARRRESALLTAHLEATRASAPQLVRVIWEWLSSPEQAPFLRVFFEVYVQAMNQPEAYSERGRPMVTDWLDQFGSVFVLSPTDGDDTGAATLVIAAVRGLALDRLSTGDARRTDGALELFAQLLEQQIRDDPHGSRN
jgi:AcrR family transcriptional regulator